MDRSDLVIYWMEEAIKEAKRAENVGEVPIGAVAVIDNEIVERAYNVREATQNPLGHAEILLIQKLARKQESWRLSQTTIIVTCEPCPMCMGALLQARIPRLIYGCKDSKAGACGSLFDLSSDPRLNHQVEVTEGVLGDRCAHLLSSFFQKLRDQKKEALLLKDPALENRIRR